MISFRRFLAFLLLLAAPAAVRAVGDFHIQLNPGPTLAANAEALAAFQRAAAEWEQWLSSPITIYVDADLDPSLGANVIGSSAFTLYSTDGSDINLPYATVRNAMAARATTPGLELLAALPTSQEVSAHVPVGAQLDLTTLGVVRANQRALGLLSPTDTRADAQILFNSAFTFDYNRFDMDGVAQGKIDFQTAAAHEIGHMLGFLSDVDDFDRSPTLTSDNLTTLDLFRFPANQRPTSLADFTSLPRTLLPGEESVFTDLNVAYALSTGDNLGDGNQASHWKDDFLIFNGNITIGPLIGIMDPTLNSGVFEEISAADVRAFQLIGYDVVPEPSTAALFSLVVVVVGFVRRRRV